MKKGDINASLKSTETIEMLSTTCNPKVMSRCLSAPDAASRTIVIFYYLKLIQALDTKRPVEGEFVTPFYTAIVIVLFQALSASWDIISHMLVLAPGHPQLYIILNT